MKSKKTSIIISSFLLVIISMMCVSSVPPQTQVQEFPEGYVLSDQPIKTIDLNKPFRYGFILENASNGVTFDNSSDVSCTLLTSDSNGLETNIINIPYVSEYNLWGVEYLNPKDNFSEGEYNFIIQCEDGVGGASIGVFEFNDDSGILNMNLNNNQEFIIFLVLLAIGIGLILMKQGIIASIVLMGTGIIALLNEHTWLGLIIFFLGFLTMFKGGEE